MWKLSERYSSARFVRCQRGDAQCVDVGLHEIAQRPVNQLVPLQRAQAAKVGGHDAHAKMPSAISRTRMTGVQMAVVDQLDLLGVQCLAQLTDDALGAGHCGFSDGAEVSSGGILDDSQIACAIANTTVSPSMPNSLKLTQTSSEKL